MADSERLFVSTTPGLEAALADEARALGEVRSVAGGIEILGKPGVHRRANLELRTASRVMLELSRLRSSDRSALGKLNWNSILPNGEKLELELVGPRSLKELIPRSWPVERGGTQLVRIRLENDELVVSADSSGELLYRRGYRQETSHAPLRETLAAGLLQLANHDPARPLWDPMCGSGTFPIEAAWRAQDRAPGLARTFGFERWPSHEVAVWSREKSEAQSRIHTGLPAPIFASDLNAGSLGVARRNARRAGLEGVLQLARHDATVPRGGLAGPGLVISNLPFGKRVGKDTELEKLYRQFAAAVREALGGWRIALLAADGALLEQMGITWTARHRIDNGGIGCVLAIGEL